MRYEHFISAFLIKHINNQAVLLSFIQLKNEPKMKPGLILCFLIVGIFTSCGRPEEKKMANTNETFSGFETRFLDSYWKQYPCNSANTTAGPNSISVGYGKYYGELIIPDSMSFAANVQYSENWIDSLNNVDFKELNDNNKISFNILKN
jgi:hypothetical protein